MAGLPGILTPDKIAQYPATLLPRSRSPVREVSHTLGTPGRIGYLISLAALRPGNTGLSSGRGVSYALAMP